MTRRFLIGLMAVSIGCNSGGSGDGTGTAGNGTAGNGGTAGVTGTGGTTTGTGGTTTGTGGTTTGTGGTTTGTGGTTTGTGGTTTGTGGTTTGTGGTTTGTGGTTTGTGGTTTGTGGTGGTTTGTGGAAGRGGTTGTGGTAGGRGGTTGSGGAATQTSTNVTTFHNNFARTGVYVDAALTRAAAAGIHIDTTFANTAIMGAVYAQPLYLGGAGSSQPDMVVVATGQNRVYALNASTGAEVWPNVQFGTPITSTSGTDINSGNRPLNPSGVVGTPVIDPATRTLYFSSYVNMSNMARHRIHALDLANGTEKTGWPINVENVTNAESGAFRPANQNQRSALALVGGRLMVAYSGHIGDAGDYHGWVVGVSTTTPTDIVSWATRAACGGIWATSGIAAEGSSIFFTTGNTKASASGGFSAPSTYGDGEAVYKLGTSLARTTTASDFFVPSNWSSLDTSDTDISGSGVQLFDVPGATPSALVLVLGKDGNAYLLNRTNMGGMSASPVRTLRVANGTIIQAPAVYTTAMGTYFVFRGGVTGCPSGMSGGLMAVRVTAASPPAMTPAWCGGPTNASNPMVSMSNASGADAIVWVVGTNGQLNALNADTGASLLSGAAISLGTVKPHQSPIVANGHVIAASDNRIYKLTP